VQVVRVFGAFIAKLHKPFICSHMPPNPSASEKK